MFARFLAVLPDSLIQRITHENRHEREEKEKRKCDDVLRSISDEFRDTKCRCMDGDKAASCYNFPLSYLFLLSLPSYLHHI